MKAVITVTGKDSVGIIAQVATECANFGANILDISQTVIQEYFNMMMIVDISKCRKNFEDMSTGLADLGTEMGLKIRCQKSEIFEKMHRV